MTTHTTIRSYKALGFAGLLLAGTCFVLFQDVWPYGDLAGNVRSLAHELRKAYIDGSK